MWDIFLDSLVDCLKLLPFLYLSYVLVEYAEHKMTGRTKQMIYRAGKAGPLIGALVGLIPQCGFSAAAAGLFAGRMITPGTLLAVFLSTSDEMLPVMVSEGIAGSVIGKVLAVKLVTAIVIGLLADFVIEHVFGRQDMIPEHLEMCEHEHCGCEHHSIWYSAVQHTVQTAAVLFGITLVLGFVMEGFGADEASELFRGIPAVETALAALIGMIPNCAASVLITKLFLEGVISSASLFAGLLCGAGTGLIVLYRENRSKKWNLMLTLSLYVSGTAAGILAGLAVSL